jgi:ribulose-phosphate 3-epimerase
MLAANAGRLADEARRAVRAGADWIHWDVMDGHFVPNLSYGPRVVSFIRKVVSKPFDVHLMCTQPEILLEPFAKAGADSMTVHVELGARVNDLIWKIRALKKRVGLAINPATNLNSVTPFLRHVDMILVMTVNPGYGGQSFIEEMLPKIQQLQKWRRAKDLNFRIEVDGGIDYETAAHCAHAGADTFVSGTTLFESRNLRNAIRKMREAAEKSAQTPGSSPSVPQKAERNR